MISNVHIHVHAYTICSLQQYFMPIPRVVQCMLIHIWLTCTCTCTCTCRSCLFPCCMHVSVYRNLLDLGYRDPCAMHTGLYSIWLLLTYKSWCTPPLHGKCACTCIERLPKYMYIYIYVTFTVLLIYMYMYMYMLYNEHVYM